MSSLMWDTFEWSGGECPFIYEYKRVQNDWHLETEAFSAANELHDDVEAAYF